ncbi:MAG: GNVR domain-containing protein [Gemmatimonadota bacterium]
MTQDRETSAGESKESHWESGAGRSANSQSAADRGVAGWQDDEADEISLLELVNVLLKRWKLVVGLPLIAAFFALVVSLLVPAKYTATASFVPEAESEELSLPSGLVGLASQFGVAVPAGGSTSPKFYADVLASRTLNDEVLLATFSDPRTETPTDSATLLDLLKVKGENERERLEKGQEKLDDAITIDVDKETNIVSLSVETRYPELSADISNLFIALLNRFNLETRQSNARERRRFVEERMLELENELREAEEDLKSFLERNRQFEGSPDLLFQYERLQRQVTIKQEVFTTLRRQYEEARIKEVDDTPVITVIDRAVPPDKKSSPKRKLNVALALILGGFVGVFGAFGREFVERARVRDEQEYEELTSRWAALRAELRSGLSRLRRSR